jgi:hypothetical protein
MSSALRNISLGLTPMARASLNCIPSPASWRPVSRCDKYERFGTANPARDALVISPSWVSPAAFRHERTDMPNETRIFGSTDRGIGLEEYSPEYYDPTAYNQHFLHFSH